MLQNILNLEGVAVLDKKQQKTISGGEQICRITHTYLGGNFYNESYFTDGDAGSDEAEAFCVDMIVGGTADSCGYDCAYDGWGAEP